MKYSNLIIVFSFLMLLISGCDEKYDYDLNDTTWNIHVEWTGYIFIDTTSIWADDVFNDTTSFWTGFVQDEPDSITFYRDGTTSWGGTWEKTDELTFKWIIVYEDTAEYIATYYAQFRKNLDELVGHCENTKDYMGDFFAYKNSK